MTKRISIKQARRSPLDELFEKKVEEVDKLEKENSLIQDAPIEDGKLETYEKAIRKRKKEQRKEREKALRRVEEAREKARETGDAVTRTTSLVMYGYQHEWLDLKSVESGSGSGRKVSKAEIIRALVDFAIDLPLNLSGIKNEEDLQNRLEKMIKGK